MKDLTPVLVKDLTPLLVSGQYTMAAIAAHFGVHYTTVSRLVREHEEALKR